MSRSKADFKKYPIQRYPVDTKVHYLGMKRNYKLIKKCTKVSSMGSCFGIEIAKHLKKSDNYIVTEKNPFFSAKWDKLYNISSIRQVFDYSFKADTFKPLVRYWPREGFLQDPLRRDVVFKTSTPEVADENFKQHQVMSRLALQKAGVITITLGMTELWRDKRDQTVFWRVPPIEMLDTENIHEFVIQNVDDVIEEMQRIRAYIPKTNIIWTVSPVPFRATFRTDCDAVSANFYSKAVLRTAIDLHVRSDRYSHYFPSFEYIILGHENRYMADNRHIKRPIVAEVLKFFDTMFVDRS